MKNKAKIYFIFILFLLILGMSHVVSNASNDIIVMLDPGHGGNDSGAVGGGVREKDVNWKIATKVKEIIDQTPGITGILTRRENECPSLAERGELAKKYGANLLVSFHINSNNTYNILSGAETYVTGNMNSSRFNWASKKLANSVLANLRSVGVQSYCISPKVKYTEENRYYSDGSLCDYYGIIRNPMYYGIPSVLIEHCFINNPSDRINFLSNDAKIYQMAIQDARAIIDNKDLFYINKEENTINAELEKLHILQEEKYLTGEAIVVEWLNGMQTVPNCVPSIKLKATDNTRELNCYVRQVYGNKYYFDIAIGNIDLSKDYIIEIESNDKNTIPKKHTITLNIGNNRMLGNTINCNFNIENNQIKITQRKYKGNINTDLKVLAKAEANEVSYINGEIVVVEWINGLSTVPTMNPKISLRSTDGTVELDTFVKPTGTNTYYFDRYIEGIDIEKEYELVVTSADPANISEKKSKVVDYTGDLNHKTIGKYKERNILLGIDKILFQKEVENKLRE